MAKTIHVVNGDAVVPNLLASGIQGDIVVWREMLCDGPVCAKVGSDVFWKKRLDFFDEELGVSKIEYFDKTIKELMKLEDLSNCNELVMWFEFDLFCQVNLMALCAYLYKNFRKTINYTLVCTGIVNGKSLLQSLSDFNANQFVTLYENRIKLSKTNLEFATACWNIYVENNIEKLKKFNFKNTKFQYFQGAIETHLKRFPIEGGLNEIQYKILDIINSSAHTAQEIVQKLLIWQHKETIYGFGDIQYLLYLKELANFFQISEEKYFINEAGKAIIKK